MNLNTNQALTTLIEIQDFPEYLQSFWLGQRAVSMTASMVATMKTATKIQTQEQLKALTPISCLHPDALATEFWSKPA